MGASAHDTKSCLLALLWEYTFARFVTGMFFGPGGEALRVT
jgi:hypothetical protein